MDQKELMRRIIQTEGVNDWTFVYRDKKERFSGGHKKDMESKITCDQHVQVRENGKGIFPLALVRPAKPIHLCSWVSLGEKHHCAPHFPQETRSSLC